MIRFITENGRLEFEDSALTARLLEKQQMVEAQAKADAAEQSQAYTVKGLAARLKIGESAAYALVQDGKIGYCLCGQKNYRISERAVRRFEDGLPPLSAA